MKSKTRHAAVIMVCLFLRVTVNGFSEDYKSAHHVEPGDVISAEVINELFDKVADTQRTITADDLVGTWVGGSFGPYTNYGAPGWFNDSANMCWALTNAVVTISKISSNYYELKTSAPDPFSSSNPKARTNRIAVIEGTIFGIEAQTQYSIDRIDSKRIRLTKNGFYSDFTKLMTLDRQNTSPEKPKLISAEAIGKTKTVSLMWQDNSNDETGFKIVRRDSLSGDYANIATVAANTTNWTNTVTSPGIYWYRIASTNSNGTSLGSNVKRVTVP